MASICESSCDYKYCTYKQPVCKPIGVDSCQYANPSDDGARAACQAADACAAIATTATTPDAACTTALKLCPGAGCESCRAKMVEVLAGVASSPPVQCQGSKPSPPSKTQFCMQAVAPMLKAARSCAEVLPMFDTWATQYRAGNFSPFCEKLGGNGSYAPCMMIMTKAGALVQAGWFPLAPTTLYHFCMEGLSSDSPQQFDAKFSKYACDPSNNVCCPPTKLVPAQPLCEASGACRAASGCQVVYDNCFNAASESYTANLMNGKVLATCPAGCSVMASSNTGGSYTSLPLIGEHACGAPPPSPPWPALQHQRSSAGLHAGWPHSSTCPGIDMTGCCCRR
jgi:hypothetical protein